MVSGTRFVQPSRLLPLVVVLLVAALTLGLGIAGNQANASGRWTNCGVFGIEGDLLVHHVTCGKGRGLVKIFLIRAQSEGPHVAVSGFSCNGKISGREMIVNCSKGSKRVHWRGAIS
jgi:hypothetical protein